jgi:hypothetical protein
MVEAYRRPRDRDAWGVINGFVYQVDLTIRRWLELVPNEALELEYGEDIDLVSAALGAGDAEARRLLEQVKHRQTPISLVSSAAVFAIACAVEHREANPQVNLHFRFTTNGRVAKERFSHYPRQGILVWEDLRNGVVERDASTAAVGVIRTILTGTTKPAKLHVDAWASYRSLVERGTDDDLLGLIRTFEWGTGSDDARPLAAALRQRLVDSGRAADLDGAQSLYERLFHHVFKLISSAGLKRLTPTDLAGVLALPTLSNAELTVFERVKVIVADLESRVQRGEVERRQQGAMIERIDDQVQALARQQGVLASIQYGVEDVDLEIPPPCAHLSPRVIAARDIAESVSRHAWTAIDGASWTGKTQLVAIAARSWAHFHGWVRLRDLSIPQACRRLDRAIELMSGIVKPAGRQDWFRDVCQRLENGSVIVIEDLPRMAGADSLSHRLVRLAECARGADVHLLTTSCFPLPGVIRSSIAPGTINDLRMPTLTVEDARVILQSLGAPETLLTEAFVRSTNNLSQRHPLLLIAVGGYLSERGWQFRNEEFGDILSGRHTEDLNRDTIERLLNTVTDERSRELLYRLTLIMGVFSADDARALASVRPGLDRPRERLHTVTGPWVQVDARGRLCLSPLVNAIGNRDLPGSVRRRCLLRLGARTLRRGTLGPEDVCSAVTYFAGARAYDRAGLILAQALAHLNGLDRQVDPRGVLSVWHGVPLPQRMALAIRIYLRALQFVVRTRYGRPTDGLLSEIGELSQQATQREGWGVLGAAVLLGHRLGGSDRLLGIRLLRRAFELAGDFRFCAGREMEWPDGIGPEYLIWSVALELANDSELSEWMAAVDALDPDKRRQAFSYPVADPGCMLVGGALFRAEIRKPEQERNWPHVLDRLDVLADWARHNGLEVLWACSIRHRLIVLGEHVGELEACIYAAEVALRAASQDPQVRFLLSDSIGEFLLRANRPEEALYWLERALSNVSGSFAMERLLVLVNASRATAATEPAKCLAFLHEAGRCALAASDLPELEAARIQGEIAIGEGLAGNLPASFRALDYGVTQLLGCRTDTNRWKALFLLFGNTAGYFMSMATKGSPPATTATGEPYVAPLRGYFYNHDATLGDNYDASKDFAIALQLALFADAIGDDGRAAAWGASALELARGAGQEQTVEELTGRFIPQLIVDDRYDEAMEAALDHGAVLVARLLERRAGRGSVLQSNVNAETILGERPNGNWSQAESQAAMAGILPAAVRICWLALDRPDAARSSAEEIVSICRQIGAVASDPTLWSTIAELFEKSFLDPVSGEELKGIAGSLPESATTCRVLALLFASAQPDFTAENALVAQLSAMPCLAQAFDGPFAANRLILVPFVSAYWNAMFERMRFRFRHPDLVKSALAEANALPSDKRIREVMRAVLIGIQLQLPSEIKGWLNSVSE